MLRNSLNGQSAASVPVVAGPPCGGVLSIMDQDTDEARRSVDDYGDRTIKSSVITLCIARTIFFSKMFAILCFITMGLREKDHV